MALHRIAVKAYDKIHTLQTIQPENLPQVEIICNNGV